MPKGSEYRPHGACRVAAGRGATDTALTPPSRRAGAVLAFLYSYCFTNVPQREISKS